VPPRTELCTAADGLRSIADNITSAAIALLSVTAFIALDSLIENGKAALNPVTPLSAKSRSLC
jgi:hypothetical protein